MPERRDPGVAPRPAVLVAGVGHLFQGDLDLGRRAAERLGAEDLGPAVVVEDVHYGGLAFAQLLEEVAPEALVMMGAAARGRPPGTVERRRVRHLVLSPEEAREAVEGAGVGYISLDLALRVPAALGALPARTSVVEAEPARTEPAESMSAEAEAALERVLELARAEVRRAPLLAAADRLLPLLEDGHLAPAPAREAMEDLVRELALLDAEGRWGAAFAHNDRVKLRIAEGAVPEGMTHLDWGLWWSVIEGVDRLEAAEAGLPPA